MLPGDQRLAGEPPDTGEPRGGLRAGGDADRGPGKPGHGGHRCAGPPGTDRADTIRTSDLAFHPMLEGTIALVAAAAVTSTLSTAPACS